MLDKLSATWLLCLLNVSEVSMWTPKIFGHWTSYRLLIHLDVSWLGVCSCGLHSWVISIADPLDWFCWFRHVGNVEAEQQWRQLRALRDAGVDFTPLVNMVIKSTATQTVRAGGLPLVESHCDVCCRTAAKLRWLSDLV